MQLGVMQLFMLVADLQVETWLGVMKKLAVKVPLCTTLIDRCIEKIFPTERKIMLMYSKPVVIL